MNFQPELARKVMAGEKTVTRRLVSDNVRSPWSRERCSLRVNRTYAVCPGRGKHAIGRVRITNVRQIPLGLVGLSEAQREGFQTMHGFREAWKAINGAFDPAALVWRVEFVVVPCEQCRRAPGTTATWGPLLCDPCATSTELGDAGANSLHEVRSGVRP